MQEDNARDIPYQHVLGASVKCNVSFDGSLFLKNKKVSFLITSFSIMLCFIQLFFIVFMCSSSFLKENNANSRSAGAKLR